MAGGDGQPVFPTTPVIPFNLTFMRASVSQDSLDQFDLSRESLELQALPDHIDYRYSTMSQETTNRSPAMPHQPLWGRDQGTEQHRRVKVDGYSTHSTTLRPTEPQASSSKGSTCSSDGSHRSVFLVVAAEHVLSRPVIAAFPETGCKVDVFSVKSTKHGA
ncbi:hypothetical protein CGRA01v4_15028 [Colletotrichum graminicola]|uniref:Uncharacterized protein n=1 Tax=Colletotrichum graminicola (strain M1.001 / M2 / FGSC 10212) TaxID=645133 RepID=E3QYG7_COLGM|nr:uncharacterized protein GLRG_11013 [Colletotrichum graminicola M1.001]EFQ35905.1 hypothetical protein GLRG_11013 [Colletotrichum graminicola M1.001]WDK23736.1 hypothetical protein CGRA01v4_15028 [Colletotrichum graminicola]